MPKDKLFSYKENGDELSPLRVIYADIECHIEDSIHKPAAIACYEVWYKNYKNRNRMHVWQGDDCIIKFLNFLVQAAKIQQKRHFALTRKCMTLSEADLHRFNSCESCPRCNTKFDGENIKKVRDPDHITGEFRSALCSKCNFGFKMRRRVLPVIFHNFKGYDSHILIKGGLGQMKDCKLDVIAQTRENL